METEQTNQERFDSFYTELVNNLYVEVTNPLEHKFAALLVKKGYAVIDEKKNYGRIKRIRFNFSD